MQGWDCQKKDIINLINLSKSDYDVIYLSEANYLVPHYSKKESYDIFSEINLDMQIN
jgi:hypothetical protein